MIRKTLLPLLLMFPAFAFAQAAGTPALLRRLDELGIEFTDLQTRQSSLEDIFIDLVHRR